MQGKQALGPHAGSYADRIGRGSEDGGPFRRGKLCANAEGFSLHAGVLIPDYCRDKLEKLCAYAARPPVVHQRMSLSTDGSKVIYKLKKKFRDGSTHVVLDPLDLIARLAALVPHPRVNLVTYYGVLAPAASYRERVTPNPPTPAPKPRPCERGPAPVETEPGPQTMTSQRRYSWAELMRRVYEMDVLTCQHCGGQRRIVAFHQEAARRAPHPREPRSAHRATESLPGEASPSEPTLPFA